MSRLRLSPYAWLDEGPREAVRTDPRIRGCAIEAAGPCHSKTNEGQREYRERRRELDAASYQRRKGQS